MVDNGSIWPRVCSMVGDRLPGDLSLTPGVTWLTGRLALGTIRDRLGRFQFWDGRFQFRFQFCHNPCFDNNAWDKYNCKYICPQASLSKQDFFFFLFSIRDNSDTILILYCVDGV